MSLARALGADPNADAAPYLVEKGVQLTPPPDPIPPPSVLDVLRNCRPSAELHALLIRELQAATDAGNLDDAFALFALAMCVREARR